MAKKKATTIKKHTQSDSAIWKFIKNNWRLRIFSFLLALTLYFYVQVSLEVNRVIRVPILIPDLPGDLIFSEKIPGFLNVKLSGQANDLDFDVSRYRIVMKNDSLVVGDSQFVASLRPGVPDGIKVSYRKNFEFRIEQAFRRELPIIPIVQISQDDEVELKKIYYNMQPPYLMVQGPYAVLKRLNQLSTKTIYIKARNIPTIKKVFLSDLPDQITLLEKPKISLRIYAKRELEDNNRLHVVRLSSNDIFCKNSTTNIFMTVPKEVEVTLYLSERTVVPNVWVHCPVFIDADDTILPDAKIEGLPIFIDKELLNKLLFLEPQTIDVQFKKINSL